jgi:hypothetical protein
VDLLVGMDVWRCESAGDRESRALSGRDAPFSRLRLRLRRAIAVSPPIRHRRLSSLNHRTATLSLAADTLAR